MLGKIVTTLIIVFAALSLIFFNFSELKHIYLNQVKNIQQNLEPVTKKSINTPPPLKATKKLESPKSYLTAQGIIDFTNIERTKQGLPPLIQNPTLNKSAELKVKDMFNKQYFDHNSPDGIVLEDLANKVNYQFITIGENLALGNFEDDKTLVNGWMNSPGHRENILNSKYIEIGVSVIKNTYEGSETYIAVQHFGKPLSDCNQVDMKLKQTIDENNIALQNLNNELIQKRKELDEMYKEDNKKYNKKAKEYNELVNEYNDLIVKNKSLVNKYNATVNSFNNCINN